MEISRINGFDYIRIFNSSVDDNGLIKTGSIYKQITINNGVKCIADRFYHKKKYHVNLIPIDECTFNEARSLLKLRAELENRIVHLNSIICQINNLVITEEKND
jgi:hypothetical protein